MGARKRVYPMARGARATGTAVARYVVNGAISERLVRINRLSQHLAEMDKRKEYKLQIPCQEPGAIGHAPCGPQEIEASRSQPAGRRAIPTMVFTCNTADSTADS